MKKLEYMMFHLCITCGYVCVIARILDWYNPYMDFSGHTAAAQVIVCAGTVFFCAVWIIQFLKRGRQLCERQKDTV